jgi:hypothetical protein
MAKYYALVAGLPIVTAEMQRPPVTTEEFYTELQSVLTQQDRSYLELLRLGATHGALLNALFHEGSEANESSSIQKDEAEAQSDETTKVDLPILLQQVIKAAQEGKRLPKQKLLPEYQIRFVYDLFFVPKRSAWDDGLVEPTLIDRMGHNRLALEDLLAQYYYEWAERSSSSFLQEWFRLNKNIRNILAVHTCRRLGWDPTRYIVGRGRVEEQFRTSKAKDFDLGEELPYLGEVLRIAEERDIARRERLIDLLKWRWMDEWTFVRVFDIDNVLCYYLRLSILERWSELDEATGERTFREIVLSLKGESAKVLEDFKRQQRH